MTRQFIGRGLPMNYRPTLTERQLIRQGLIIINSMPILAQQLKVELLSTYPLVNIQQQPGLSMIGESPTI